MDSRNKSHIKLGVFGGTNSNYLFLAGRLTTTVFCQFTTMQGLWNLGGRGGGATTPLTFFQRGQGPTV